MVLNLTCTACQLGDHKNHVRVIHAVPEGMMGGTQCTCKGECKKRDKGELAREFLEGSGLGMLIDEGYYGSK